jgi:hypothetical protein
MSINPWVQTPERTAESGADELATTAAPAAPVLPAVPSLGPQADSVVGPRVHLPRRSIDVPRGTVALWWVGTHGGAGESTLEQLLEGSRAMGHAWPHTDERTTELPHVCRTSRSSLGQVRAGSAQRSWPRWSGRRATSRCISSAWS